MQQILYMKARSVKLCRACGGLPRLTPTYELCGTMSVYECLSGLCSHIRVC